MIAYVNAITALTKKFIVVEIKQIPREENTEVDHLARMASALEGTWKGDLAVFHADTRSGAVEICFIQEVKDMRTYHPCPKSE